MPLHSISLKPNFQIQGEEYSDNVVAVKRRETAERMRRWRASNAEKNRENDTRCRVYRVAREKFGIEDSSAKSAWIDEEISRRNAKRRQRNSKLSSMKMPIDEFKPIKESQLPYKASSKGSYSSYYSSSLSTPNSSKHDNSNNTSWLPFQLPHQQVVLSPTQNVYFTPEIPPIRYPLPSHSICLMSLEPPLNPPCNDKISLRALDRLNQSAIQFLTS